MVDRLRPNIDEDVLGFGVQLDGRHAELPPDAGHLVATERRLRVDAAVRVDRQDARLNPLRGSKRLADVAAPDRAGEAVRRGIGQPDRLLLGIERDDRHDRPEDLLAGDPHVVVDAVEHRRHQVGTGREGCVIRGLAADDEGRALAEADLDVVPNAVTLLEADERADLGRLVLGIADLHVPGCGGEQLHDLLVDRPLDEDPAAGAAILATVVEDRVG